MYIYNAVEYGHWVYISTNDMLHGCKNVLARFRMMHTLSFLYVLPGLSHVKTFKANRVFLVNSY